MPLFGPSKTPAERMEEKERMQEKEKERQMKKQAREKVRELAGLERREKQLMADIKKEAKAGQNESAKIKARELVRTRGELAERGWDSSQTARDRLLARAASAPTQGVAYSRPGTSYMVDELDEHFENGSEEFISVETTFMAQKEFLELANAKCDGEQGVLVTQRSDLPISPDDCEFDVYYAEESIMGTVGSLLNLTHSGIILKTRGHRPDHVPEAMTLQYCGVSFGPDVVLPRIVRTSNGATMEWRNSSMICFSPMELPTTRWGAVMQRVGFISGTVFNQFCEWVAPYSENNPGYQMWDVWDSPDASLATRFVNGAKCDEFIEASLRALHRLGGCLDTEEVLYKNTIPFLCREPPTTIDMSIPEQATEVLTFYERLSALGMSLAGADSAGKGLTLPALLRTIATTLDVFIVYDRRANTYHRVTLAPPYICMDKLYQPMLMPWQQSSKPDGSASTKQTAQDLGAGVMLSGMATRAVGVLKERLPGIVLNDTQRAYIRSIAIAAIAATVWMLTQVAPNAVWYVVGMLNGAVLLPIVLAAGGELALSESKSR